MAFSNHYNFSKLLYTSLIFLNLLIFKNRWNGSSFLDPIAFNNPSYFKSTFENSINLFLNLATIKITKTIDFPLNLDFIDSIAFNNYHNNSNLLLITESTCFTV